MSMKITRKSVLSGIERTLDLDVTEEQLRAWNRGMLIQDAMPNLRDDEREFILSGAIQEEWDAYFSDTGDNE